MFENLGTGINIRLRDKNKIFESLGSKIESLGSKIY